MRRRTGFIRPSLVMAAFLLAACSGIKTEPPNTLETAAEQRDSQSGKLFGDSLTFGFGDSRSERGGTGPAEIGVNTFLWRASLDTMSFIPLASADPFGGVIISDWYAPPESPDERFKVTVYILGTELRSDGIRATVFRQARDGSAGWLDAPIGADTSVQLEDAILTRARQLRVASLQ